MIKVGLQVQKYKANASNNHNRIVPTIISVFMKKQAFKPFLGLFLSWLALCSHALEVEPYCLMTGDHIGVNLTGSLKYKDGTFMSRHVYIDCSRLKCEGFIRASSWFSTRTIRDLNLDYKNSTIAIMRAGLSEFRLDRVTRSFTWIENPYETSGKLEAKCPQFSGTAADQ